MSEEREQAIQKSIEELMAKLPIGSDTAARIVAEKGALTDIEVIDSK